MNLATCAPRALFILAIGLAAVLSSEKANAITDTAFKYSSPQTGYFSIDPMAMIPDGTNAANNYFVGWTGGLTTTGGNQLCFNTGVNLPHGAVVQNIKIVYRSGAGGDVFFRFLRKKVSTGDAENLATQVIADDAATRTSASFIVDATVGKINNKTYSYGLGVCISSNDAFFSAVIEYTYTKAGD